MTNRYKPGKRCSSACVTRDHRTFGECMRAKSLQVKPNLSNTQAVKNHDAELQAYRNARAQGIQPAGTTMAKVREAEMLSDMKGSAFNADNPFS